MLVISRKVGESVHIGDTINVVVIDVVGNKVRLGIEAPKEVNIRRDEVRENKNRSMEIKQCPSVKKQKNSENL
jgi:carbon storage regulator